MTIEQDAVIVEAKQTHRASIIWLHGLGADGHDFEPIVPELGLADALGARFIFPNAPVRPVTINGGMAMRAWYDVRSPNLREQEDKDGIIHSAELVNQYIQAERDKGIDNDKIILAGFSQGGAMTLYTGLRQTTPLAGLLALSCYLPLPEQLHAEASMDKTIPIMMAHGTFDPVIPVAQGKNSSQSLIEHGYNVEWNEYMMEHAVCLEEIRAIGDWLNKQLG